MDTRERPWQSEASMRDCHRLATYPRYVIDAPTLFAVLRRHRHVRRSVSSKREVRATVRARSLLAGVVFATHDIAHRTTELPLADIARVYDDGFLLHVVLKAHAVAGVRRRLVCVGCEHTKPMITV